MRRLGDPWFNRLGFKGPIPWGNAPGGYAGVAWNPTNIAGCVLWLDANQITGLNNGDPVATWSDMSGNGNDATQAVGANQPTYRTGRINGLPAVDFDGGNDFLTANGAAPSFSGNDLPMSCFFVLRS